MGSDRCLILHVQVDMYNSNLVTETVGLSYLIAKHWTIICAIFTVRQYRLLSAFMLTFG